MPEGAEPPRGRGLRRENRESPPFSPPPPSSQGAGRRRSPNGEVAAEQPAGERRKSEGEGGRLPLPGPRDEEVISSDPQKRSNFSSCGDEGRPCLTLAKQRGVAETAAIYKATAAPSGTGAGHSHSRRLEQSVPTRGGS